MEIQKSLRYRINVSQTSTGKKGWECTVDGEGYLQDDLLRFSDALVERLEKRYPAPVEKEK